MIELTRNQKIGFGFGVAGVLAITFALVLYFVVIRDTPKPPIKSSGSTKADTDPIAKAEAASNAKALATAKAEADAKAEAAEADAAAKAEAKAAAEDKAAAEAAAKAALAKAKDLEPIEIEGSSYYNKEVRRHSAHNNNSLREKDRLINNNQGCWTFLNVYPDDFKIGVSADKLNVVEALLNQGEIIFITKVTLPSDVRAEAFAGPMNPANGVCQDKYTVKAYIQPGQTTTFSRPTFKASEDAGKTFVFGLKFFRV